MNSDVESLKSEYTELNEEYTTLIEDNRMLRHQMSILYDLKDEMLTQINNLRYEADLLDKRNKKTEFNPNVTKTIYFKKKNEKEKYQRILVRILDDTVDSLIEKIANRMKIAKRYINLYYDGKKLKPRKLLKRYHISAGSEITYSVNDIQQFVDKIFPFILVFFIIFRLVVCGLS